MTSVRPAKLIDDFAANPLVIWIQSYLGACKASNDQLANGLLLNNILNIIDPNAFSTLHIRNNGVNDVSSRAQNLVEILNGIKRYYQEKLQQVVVMKMPDILLLAKESHSELSYSAMNDILLLILGCAIQCEKKEEFIEHIKQLDVDVQRGLVASIQEITENPDNVIPYRVNELGEISRDELLVLCENLYRHLQGAMEQRDDYIETIIDFVLLQDSEEGAREEREGSKEVEESPKFRPRNSITQASFHSNNLLQAKKEKISNLQAELDEQNVVIVDMKEELEQVKMQLESMRLENKHLVSEAAWAKTYRDEIDVLKSQLENANKLRAENGRLKAIAEDVEFYKKKYEELQDQTEQLYEEKEVLAGQAKDSTNKLQRLNLLENENKKLCTQVNLLVEEQGEDQRRIRELVDEIAKLSIEKQESISACSVMNAELAGLKMQKEDDGLNVPLMVEYNQSADLLRLEKDNRNLQTLVSTMGASDNRIKSLEDYNRNLAENIVYYKNLIGKLIKCLILAGDTNQEISDVAKKEHMKNLQMLANLKQSAEPENITADLDQLAQLLAQKGVVVDISTLKEAIGKKGDTEKGDESVENGENGEVVGEKSRLRQTLDEREKRILQLEAREQLLKEMERRSTDLEKDIANKNQTIAHLKQREQMLKEMEEKSADMEKDIANKNHTIANLEQSMADVGSAQEENLTKLKNEITTKDESIVQLKDNLDRSNELITRMSSQLKSDISEKEQKMVKLKQSEQKLKEVKQRNTDLENDIANKDQTIAHLKESLDSLNEVSDANSHLKEKLEEEEKNASSIKEKAEEARKLKEEIANVKAHNEEMKDVINTKDQKIELMQQSLDGMQQLAVLNNELRDTLMIRERKISHLEKTVNDWEEKGRNEQEKTSEEEGKQESEKGKLMEREATLQKKEVELKEKETKIKEKEAKLKDKESQIKETKGKLESKEKKIKLRETEIVYKENEVNGKENEVREKETEIKEKEKKVELKEEKIKVRENEIKQKEVAIEDKAKEIKEKGNQVEERENGIQEKGNVIKEQGNELKLKNKEIEEKEKEVTMLQERILEVTGQLARSEEKYEELKTSGDMELKKLTEKMPELQRCSSESSKLKSIVKEKDNQIMILHENLNECQCKASQLETRIDELTSANSHSTLASQQQEERVTSLKQQLEEYLSTNRTLTNELKMKEEKLKVVSRSLDDTMKRNNSLEEDINMLEKDLEQLKQTGSLKNITNITEKIKLTKRARTELHIQRAPLKKKTANVEVKSSGPTNAELIEYRELVEKLHQENQCMEKQTASMTEDLKNLSNENAALQSENETIVSTLNLLKLDYEAIQKEMDEAREHFQELDISATKIAHRCEVLVQLNTTLEEENKAMMEQVNKLFAQNQELLVSTLYNREQYIEDERAFSEHIYELEREKEKLSDQIYAAEKALQQDYKRKGALWRGTRKILKMAGLSKRKDSNPRPELDVQDIEKDCNIVPLTRENRISLESVNSVRGMGRLSHANSPPFSSIRLNQRNGDETDAGLPYHNPSHRPSLRNGIDEPPSLLRPAHGSGDETYTQSPKSYQSPKNNQRKSDDDSVPCTHRGVLKNENSSPVMHRLKNGDDNGMALKPTTQSTPIQKVFVTQLTTPQVMKASPDGMTRDYPSRNSPTFIRKLPSNQQLNDKHLTKQQQQQQQQQPRKASLSTSSGRSSPISVDGMQISNSSYIDETPAIDKESKLLDRRRYDNSFREIMTDTMSLDSSDDNVMYKKHPDEVQRTDITSPSHVPPFGSREQRSSFRRYEIEHMEPRPLPHNGSGWFGSEENLLTNNPPPTAPQQSKPVNRKKLPPDNNYSSSDEQRTSLRNVMIGKVVTGSSGIDIVPATKSTSPPTSQRKSTASNGNWRKVNQTSFEYDNGSSGIDIVPATKPTTPTSQKKGAASNGNGRKVEQSWYEYGHV